MRYVAVRYGAVGQVRRTTLDFVLTATPDDAWLGTVDPIILVKEITPVVERYSRLTNGRVRTRMTHVDPDGILFEVLNVDALPELSFRRFLTEVDDVILSITGTKGERANP